MFMRAHPIDLAIVIVFVLGVVAYGCRFVLRARTPQAFTAAGAWLRPVHPQPFTALAKMTYHFIGAVKHGNKLEVDAIGMEAQPVHPLAARQSDRRYHMAGDRVGRRPACPAAWRWWR